MRQTIITIHTQMNVSTIQIKSGKHYIAEVSGWTNKAKFPFKALLKGFYKLIKLQLKDRLAAITTKINNTLEV